MNERDNSPQSLDKEDNVILQHEKTTQVGFPCSRVRLPLFPPSCSERPLWGLRVVSRTLARRGYAAENVLPKQTAGV